ncbi:hypothetical protein [Microbacterium tumbae]
MSMTEATLDHRDRAAVLIVSWLSAVALALTLAGLGFSVSHILLADSVSIPGVLPAQPETLGALSGGQVTASASAVDVEVTDAPASVRAPLVGAAVTSALVPLAVTAVLFFAGRQVARQRFRQSLAIGIGALAAVTFGGALFAPFLCAVAGAEALELGPLGADAPFAFTVDGMALAVPALLLLIGILLAVSHHLQRDAEGLV